MCPLSSDIVNHDTVYIPSIVCWHLMDQITINRLRNNFKHLRTLKHIFVVNNDIDRVWEFYTDIKHLATITPTEMNLKIINSTTGQKLIQGSEIWIAGKIIFQRKTTWHSRITFLKLYEYVDEMLKGPFKKWRHLHRFHEINEKQTQIIDEVEFELPYGIVGKLLFEDYTYNRLEKIFAYRRIATIKALESI